MQGGERWVGEAKCLGGRKGPNVSYESTWAHGSQCAPLLHVFLKLYINIQQWYCF